MWQETISEESNAQTRKRRLPPRKQCAPRLELRRHLTKSEIDAMVSATRISGAHGLRNALLILLAYRHALRVSELLALTWSDINLEDLSIHIRRKNNGTSSTHQLNATEAGWLCRLRRAASDSSNYVFCSDKGLPLARRTAHFIISKAAEQARIDVGVHPHMLRHARAFHLVSKGLDTRRLQAYMGHRNAKHTLVYVRQ